MDTILNTMIKANPSKEYPSFEIMIDKEIKQEIEKVNENQIDNK